MFMKLKCYQGRKMYIQIHNIEEKHNKQKQNSKQKERKGKQPKMKKHKQKDTTKKDKQKKREGNLEKQTPTFVISSTTRPQSSKHALQSN